MIDFKQDLWLISQCEFSQDNVGQGDSEDEEKDTVLRVRVLTPYDLSCKIVLMLWHDFESVHSAFY